MLKAEAEKLVYPIKTFFLEPIGLYELYDADYKLTGRRCTEEQIGLPEFAAPMWAPLYRRLDTGEEMTWSAAPTGAMYYSEHTTPGPDGKSLVVKLQDNHDWYVDSRASNCDLPDDKEHRCWVRHGNPRQANVTVDKNGLTCKAGAGSILIPNWHGYLRNGELVLA